MTSGFAPLTPPSVWRRLARAGLEVKRAAARWQSQLPESRSAAERYGLAVVSVAASLGTALLLGQHGIQGVEFPLFLFAIAITVWYAGPRPAVLALALSSLAFDYFYTDPPRSFAVTSRDLPYLVVFVLFASLLTWFSTVRHRVERDLVQSRDALAREVVERTQQASLLNLTHDSIFVRGVDDVITYWNRGAEELYGWTAGDAIGRNAHELLHAVFPKSLDAVRAELLSSGRWEGEIQKTRADGTGLAVASRWSLRRDEQGRAVAILETNNDISQRKRREQEVRALNEELEIGRAHV